jgi:hypothetical protein
MQSLDALPNFALQPAAGVTVSLLARGVRDFHIDITRSGVTPTAPIQQFLHEEAITPEQIGAYKVALHQQFLQAWRSRSAVAEAYTFADLWHIREACIVALGQ